MPSTRRAKVLMASAVLMLRHEHIDVGERVTLRFDQLTLEMPDRLAKRFAQVTRGGTGFVFPGRSGQRPLSTGAVYQHVRKRRYLPSHPIADAMRNSSTSQRLRSTSRHRGEGEGRRGFAIIGSRPCLSRTRA